MKSLPPLNSLRAFEASARHLSFSKAAEELNVTPGAISQQIKLLENYLNIPLFKRRNRQIILTESGQIFLPRLSEAFKVLTEAVESIQTYDEDEPLTITAPPSFISKWLIPRLCNFNRLHPDINVRIDSSTRLIDFDQEKVDIGIRFSPEQDNTLDSTYLMSLEIIAVCSPSLIQEGKGLHKPSDLAHQTLLNYENESDGKAWPDWAMWLATMGIDNIDPSGRTFFNQADMLVQAAIEGQGVALVSTVVAESDIRSGRLVQPFDLSMPIHFSYYLVTSFQKSQRKKIQIFKQWILEQSS